MDFIASSKERATEAMDYFLRVLSFVPEDKLTWKPSPTAKSALEIAAHCAGYSGAFAWIIRAGKFPCSVEEFRATVRSAGMPRMSAASKLICSALELSIPAMARSKLLFPAPLAPTSATISPWPTSSETRSSAASPP